jgi:hypothetical protein
MMHVTVLMFMDISLIVPNVPLVIPLSFSWNLTTLLFTIRPSITQLPNLLDLLPLLHNDRDIRTLTMERKSLPYNSLFISRLQVDPLREQKISKFIRVFIL